MANLSYIALQMRYREADHEEASEDNDDGLVDMDDDEDKDESSFDERLGGSCSATLLNILWVWPPWVWWGAWLPLCKAPCPP